MMKVVCSQYCEKGKMFYVEYMWELSSTSPFYKEYIGKCWKRFFCKRYWGNIINEGIQTPTCKDCLQVEKEGNDE